MSGRNAGTAAGSSAVHVCTQLRHPNQRAEASDVASDAQPTARDDSRTPHSVAGKPMAGACAGFFQH
jgi:hypothetical protein